MLPLCVQPVLIEAVSHKIAEKLVECGVEGLMMSWLDLEGGADAGYLHKTHLPELSRLYLRESGGR